MEPWRTVWRDDIAPRLPEDGLIRLFRALINDDHRLIQGMSVSAACTYRVLGACAISYCLWDSPGMKPIDLCMRFDDFMKAHHVPFFTWFDSVPRQEMRFNLLIEVQRELARRGRDDEIAEDVGTEGVGTEDVSCFNSPW